MLGDSHGDKGSVEGETITEGGDFPLWLPITAAILALAFAALTLTAICGPLSGLLMPPTPPIPPGAELVEARSEEYGVDDWLYTLEVDPCEVMAFYHDEEARCSITPGICSADGRLLARGRDVNVGRCIGLGRFSIFTWRYEVWIGGRVDEDDSMTVLRVFREVDWLGRETGE